MLHFQPPAEPFETPQPNSEALARIAGIRHALSLVEPFGSGPADDADRAIHALDAGWAQASGATRRCVDNRSERVIAGTAAGLDALLAERAAGREPNEAAAARIAEEIRIGLENVSRLMAA